MKKAIQLALGILTAIGGFFDIGNLVTGAQAGASFRFQLLWALLLGTIIVIFLVEMSGRLAGVTKKALPEAIREHFGVSFWLPPFILLVLVHVLTLAAEIGGISFACSCSPESASRRGRYRWGFWSGCSSGEPHSTPSNTARHHSG